MSSKLIFIPFAYSTGKATGANVAKENSFEIYCKNFCTALVSIKKENPDCDVALVTNCAIPQRYEHILSHREILVYHEDYNSFLFPDSFKWSLAFYKLCALKSVLQYSQYSHYCYMDADVIANGPMDFVWEECVDHIMLYDINHGLGVRDYRLFLRQVEGFTKERRCITHYGGEFFAATRENAIEFIRECEKIYDKLITERYSFECGDEFILSLAADRLKHKVKNAGAYIFRFWTGTFRLVSTCYEYNAVSVLHLPSEKQSGIINIFEKYIARGKYPSKKRIYKLCHLRHQSVVSSLKAAVKRLWGVFT